MHSRPCLLVCVLPTESCFGVYPAEHAQLKTTFRSFRSFVVAAAGKKHVKRSAPADAVGVVSVSSGVVVATTVVAVVHVVVTDTESLMLLMCGGYDGC